MRTDVLLRPAVTTDNSSTWLDIMVYDNVKRLDWQKASANILHHLKNTRFANGFPLPFSLTLSSLIINKAFDDGLYRTRIS